MADNETVEKAQEEEVANAPPELDIFQRVANLELQFRQLHEQHTILQKYFYELISIATEALSEEDEE